MTNHDFELIETVSGEWVKAARGVRAGTLAIKLPNGLLLTHHVSNHAICFHSQDKDEIYHYLGDVTFNSEETNELSLNVFSPSIETLMIGETKTPVSNDLANISRIDINFSKKQFDKWYEKHVPSF